MTSRNEVKTDMSDFKGPIKEWFEALTGAIAHFGACRPPAHGWQNAQPSVAPSIDPRDVELGIFLLRLLGVGGMAFGALYMAQSVNWLNVGVNLLLKATGSL